LPYLEEKSLYDLAKLDNPTDLGIWHSDPAWEDANRRRMVSSRPKVMVCPSDPSAPGVDAGLSNNTLAATGSYAACHGTYGVQGGSWGTGISTTMKCGNTGMFNYLNARKRREVSDGHSKTFAFGEVQGADTPEGSNVWTTASRVSDTLRTTTNAVNTPPGTGIVFVEPYPGSTLHNAAFGSYHPDGAHFVYVDAHVDWVNEFTNTTLYSAYATVAGGENQ
jgi:hypothetical protein